MRGERDELLGHVRAIAAELDELRVEVARLNALMDKALATITAARRSLDIVSEQRG